MNQKLLITLTVVSLSFTAFLSGYLVSQKDFHKKNGSVSTGNILNKFNNQDTDNPPEALLRSENSGTLRPLSQRGILSPVLSKEKNSILYYEKDTGKVFEVALSDFREKPVSDVPLPNLIKTIWASSRKEVVSVFYSQKGSRYKYFNYKTRASVDLGTDIKSLAFSPDGNQIVYFGSKGGSRGIFISQPDGSSFKNILPSRLENARVYWPSNDLLAFKIDTPAGSELYSLSKAGEVKKIIDTRDGLEIKWSGDGSKVLFSQKVNSGLGLFYKDIYSEIETPLNISTSASKCDWGVDAKTIVCGIPRSSGAGDEIYEIRLDGTQKLFSSPTSRINTAELFLSGLGDFVVILNSLDNKLYVLKK